MVTQAPQKPLISGPKRTVASPKGPKWPLPEANYQFPVELRPVKTIDGLLIPGKKAIVRTDTNIVFGIVGTAYKVFPHAEVLKQLEENLPVTLKTRKLFVCRGGKHMFARYQSAKVGDVEVSKGDIVSFGIEIFNSYSGQNSIAMRMFANRLICTNGMTAPNAISAIRVQHRSSLVLKKVRETFHEKIKQYYTCFPIWRSWTRTHPKGFRVDEFLRTRVKSKTAREIIANKFQMDNDHTLWGLFNALTWYGSHILRPRFADKPAAKQGQEQSLIIDRHRDAARLQFEYDHKVVEPFYSFKWN